MWLQRLSFPLICLSISACSPALVKPSPQVIPGPTKYIQLTPPAPFLTQRPLPLLAGDTVDDYISYALQCRTTLLQSNQDKQNIVVWGLTQGTSGAGTQ